MDNTVVQKLKETIAKSSAIGVAVGPNPTVDEMGAALSLYLLLKQTKKTVSIASASEPIVEVSSLVGIDKVQNSLSGEAGDLVVSFPYEEGEIEKVSYSIENGFLNIIVKFDENGLSFEDKDVKYTRGSGAVDLLFVVGTPRLADITPVIDSQKLSDIRIVNIDNKKENQGFGDIVLVSPQFSSISEQIADIALSLGLNIDQDIAQNLLSGLTFATQNFQDPRTSVLAFELAAMLLKKGAVRSRGERLERLPRREERPQQQQNGGGTGRLHAQTQEQRQPQVQEQRQPQQRAHELQQQQAQGHQRPQPHQQPRQEEQRQRPIASQSQDRQQAIQDELKQEQAAAPDETPVDWLAPKVYKGSSNF